MAKITFVAANGAKTVVDAEHGQVLMRAAVDNGVPGIEAECGGSMMCATCHVFIPETYWHLTGPREEGEDEMLEGAAAGVRETSRLSCRIVIGPEHDGLVVHLPEAQY